MSDVFSRNIEERCSHCGKEVNRNAMYYSPYNDKLVCSECIDILLERKKSFNDSHKIREANKEARELGYARGIKQFQEENSRGK